MRLRPQRWIILRKWMIPLLWLTKTEIGFNRIFFDSTEFTRYRIQKCIFGWGAWTGSEWIMVDLKLALSHGPLKFRLIRWWRILF